MSCKEEVKVEEIKAYEKLNRFEELYPEFNSINKILEHYKIGSGGEAKFVQDFGEYLEGGSREAREIYRTAADISEKAALIWANIKDATAPYYSQVIFNNLPDSFLNKLRSIPAYDRLFGSLDYISCDHCRSIFGPAAYFADLMRFVQTYINDENRSTIPEKCALNDRRPDLAKIRLDCNNSTDIIPSIDLVNEILETFLETTGVCADAYKHAKDAIFPQSLPFNSPRAEIQSYLKSYETNLWQIYQAFNLPFIRNPFENKLEDHTAREFLQLSPEDFRLITNEISSQDISKYFGEVDLNGADGLENLDVLLEQMKLTREELNELVYQNLDRHEINAGFNRLSFINSADDGLGPLFISIQEGTGYDKLLNLSPAKLDRMYRFLKLSRKLNWSFTDLDWALRSLYQPYLPERVLKFDGIDDYISCRNAAKLDLLSLSEFTIEGWISPESSASHAALGLLISRDEEQYHLYLGVNPAGKLVFCIFRILSATEGKAESQNIFEIESFYDSIPNGIFTHVAVSYANNKFCLFINGNKVLINENNECEKGFIRPVFSSPINCIEMDLGRDLFDNYFYGCIKEVRIWQKAHDKDALQEGLYQRFTGKERDLIGYWPMVEGLWDYLPDLTPGGSNGALGGGEFSAQPEWVCRELILDPLPQEQSSLLKFNGIDQYLAAEGFNLAETDQITIEVDVEIEARLEAAARQDDCILCLSKNSQNAEIALLLYSSAQGNLVFKFGSSPTIVTSSKTLPMGQKNHVCVTYKKETDDVGTVKIYVNNEEPDSFDTPSFEFKIENGLLNVGRNFSGDVGGNYLIGMISELRIWSRERTDEQVRSYLYRKVPTFSQGIAGYWQLDEIKDGKVRDISENGNDLYLGGILRDYSPSIPSSSSVPPAEILPMQEDMPAPAVGTVLQFDGDNDVIVIRNPENRGLGRHERFTIELWLNASAPIDTRRKQVLFSQGDGEAGLCIYLFEGNLCILEWNNTLENASQNIPPTDKTILKIPFPDHGRWHHIAITQNEFPRPIQEEVSFPLDNCFYKKDTFELKVYLYKDIQNENIDTDIVLVSTGYKLCPVGPIYLGGLGKLGKTCFDDAYSDRDNIYFFAGQIASLGIWSRVKSADEIKQDRYFAPSISEDLITYLPMNEGEGWYVQGWEENNRHIGTLQDRNIGLVCSRSDPELINIYSHYWQDSLSWSNYCFSGRMQIKEENASIGITFYSRHIEGIDVPGSDVSGIDQCYILGRDAIQTKFHLFAHPSGVQGVKSSSSSVDMRTTDKEPEKNVWYHFLVKVETDDTKTNIKAKIWSENEEMPDAFEIDAYDDSSIRINSGTVGLWTTGSVSSLRQFDNLKVWDSDIIDPLPSQLRLDINFEAESQMPEPSHWLDGEDRQKLALPGGLFKQVTVQGGAPGETAFGTDSEDLNIHSYFCSPDKSELNWNNCLYSGRMRISHADGGIGVVFFSRQAEGIDQYYRLSRDAQHLTFRLTAHPQDVQKVKSFDPSVDKRDSGITPLQNVWYNFLIEVYDSGTFTRIKAKIWSASENVPAGYAIDAIDDSDIRIKSGAAGVWASATGSKYFSQLKVQLNPMYNESFSSYSAGQDPANWRDTNLFNSEDNSLFKTYTLDGKTVFGTKYIPPQQWSQLPIHTHYIGSGASNWKNHTFVGCFRIGDPSDGIGVTVLSQYFPGSQSNRYYKLASLLSQFNPGQYFMLLNELNNPLKGISGTFLKPLVNTWYRFLIEVEDTGSRTNIRAKIWPESQTEPTNYQINAYDDAANRLSAGTVGFLTTGYGSKYFKDLSVFASQHLLNSTASGMWHDITMRASKRGAEVDDLFKTADLLDNTPHWVRLPSDAYNYDYPVLLHPLSRESLEFDGKRGYLAAKGYGKPASGQLSLQAWICPYQIKESNFISLTGRDSENRDIVIAFGMDGSGRLKLYQKQAEVVTVLAVSQDSVLETMEFCHVALSENDSVLAFFVDGVEVVINLLTPGLLGSSGLDIERVDIGRGIIAGGMDGNYFSGRIKDVRIWNRPMSGEDIRFSMYQKASSSNDLLGCWYLGEAEGGMVPDHSDLGNDMRIGGLEEDRCPVLADVAVLGFWRPDRRALNFNGTSHLIKYGYNRASDVVSHCTIEVWFLVEDKDISQQKQIIYHEGDDQCGLSIYVCDGSLYFGGYNLSCGWKGTWLNSDRVESGRWHHAALVLDGRGEVRDESLRVYLDGKLMGSGPASQITGPNVSYALGGLRSSIRFHDDPDSPYVGSSGQLLCGQILCLRIWNSSRSDEQIRDNFYREPEEGANQLPGLDLWWESNIVNAVECKIIDQSWKGHDGTYPAEQLQAMRLPGIYELPSLLINDEALDGIAIIKLLMERSSLDIDRLTALWYVIKHSGYDNSTPLFDKIFNPKGAVMPAWDYYAEPMRWDKSGQEEPRRDSQIRSRLMGAIRLSDSDLNLIVEYLSGKDELIIELDFDYLSKIFQMSQLARMLGLSVADLLQLLPMQEGRPNSLPDVLKISNIAEWLSASGLSVADLIYFACPVTDPNSANISLYTESDISSLAEKIFSQFASFAVNAKTFQSDHVSEALSGDIFDFLNPEIVTDFGAVAQSYSDEMDLSHMLEELAETEDWMTEYDVLKAEFDKVRAGLGDEIFGRHEIKAEDGTIVQTKIIGRLQSHGFLSEWGLVLYNEDYSPESLKGIFDGQTPAQKVLDLLPKVTEKLVERKAIQDMLISADGPVRTALESSLEGMDNIIESELASLFDVKKEMMTPILGFFGDEEVDRLIAELNSMLPTKEKPKHEISEELLTLLFKMSKLVYLAESFELTVEEMALLIAHPEDYSVSDLLAPTMLDLNNLYCYKQLHEAFGDTEGLLDNVLALPFPPLPDNPNETEMFKKALNEIDEAIFELTGWEPKQLAELVEGLKASNYNTVPGIWRLKECFDIAALLKTAIHLPIQLSNTEILETEDEYDFYIQRAAELLEVLRAAYTEEQWPDIIKPIHDELAVLRRDALLALAIEELPKYWDEYAFCWDNVIATPPEVDEDAKAAKEAAIDELKIFLGRTLKMDFVEDATVTYTADTDVGGEIRVGPDDGEHVTIVITKVATADEEGAALLTDSDGFSMDLIVKMDVLGKINVYRQTRFSRGEDAYHEYFLMDMQVGAEMDTSRIVQATAALQYYVQRCLMNLEPGVDPATVLAVEWEWVKNYRVWEANRKVFLYPENYIEPDLRDTKTPFFEELEQELMQSDISQESVEAAYIHYLEKFAEVANLKIVGSYLHIDDPKDQASSKVLYLVGKTRDDPGTFYLREHIEDKSGERWLPWQKIDIVINSDFVTPVYAFGKLFLFWTEFTELKEGTDGTSETKPYYNLSVKYTYLNFSQEWKPPQSWMGLLPIKLEENEYHQARWQRVYAQNLSNLNLPEKILEGGEEIDAKVLQIDSETNIAKTIPEFDMSTLTWEFWVKFENPKPEGWLGWKDGVEVEREDCIQSTELVNYSYRSFEAEAHNNLVEIAGYQQKVDAAKSVVFLTTYALAQINQNYFSEGAAIEEDARAAAVAAAFDEKDIVAGKAEAARDAANDAANKAIEAQNARMSAVNERMRYNFMVQENQQNPGTWTNEEIAAQLAIAEEAEAAANEAEGRADDAAEYAKTKAGEAKAAADNALSVERAKPKWLSKDVILSLFVSSGTTPCIDNIEIDFGFWNHIAVTMKTVAGKYSLKVYKNGELVTGKDSAGVSPLTALGSIVVGKQDGAVQNAFVAQMSELRLWSSERSQDEIIDNMGYRMSMIRGLFSLPLNEECTDDPGCNMTPVESVGFNFTILPLNGLLAGISERERLILFFGDRIMSLRNNLKDKSFIMVLEPNWSKIILDVNLSYDAGVSGKSRAILHLVETNGLSINDFAASEEGSIARPTTLPEKFVDESKFLLKNLEGSECLFFDVNNQPGWYVVNTGDDQFLMKMVFLDPKIDIPPTSEIMKVVYSDIPDEKEDPQELVVSFEIDEHNPLLTETYQVTSINTGIKTFALAISPSGENVICAEDPRYLTGDVVGKINKVNLATNGIQTKELKLTSFYGDRIAIALNADGNRAATIHTYAKYVLSLWNCESGDLLKSMDVSPEFLEWRNIYLLALSNNPTNPVVVSASKRYRYLHSSWIYELVVWHPNNGSVHYLGGHTGALLSLAVTPDGKRCVSTSADGTIKLWNLEAHTCLKTLPEPDTSQPKHVWRGGDAVAISDDGLWIAAVESGKKIRVWDLNNSIVSYMDLPESGDQIISLCFFETAGSLIVVGGCRDSKVRFWDVGEGKIVNIFSGHSQRVSAVCSRNEMIASASDDKTVKLWSRPEEDDTKMPKFLFERLSSFAVYELSENLFKGGIDGLLSLSSQETPELDFWSIYEPNVKLVPKDQNSKIKDTIDFRGSYRDYYEEVFFHIPFLIANKLNSNQAFEESQKWYHYIFNPTANDAGDGSGKDRYWRYLPFKKDSFESLKTLLTGPALAAYREDPFDPHAIAALRMTAYKKAVVMKYIDNLLDWGDALFMQDSRESINEATGLYALAYDLLGPRPKSKTIKRFQEIGTYEEFIQDYEEDSEFLTEVEKMASSSAVPVAASPHRNIITDFCVPENAKFIGYWDLVEDRLFKIRHSQNIEGIYRQLALFSPPLEPMDLVRAVASGAGIGGALAELNVAVPHYRYPIVVGLAKEMAGNAISLGSALLDAIEKRDAEKLANLQNTQERTLLDLMTTIKETAIESNKLSKDELAISKKSTDYKVEHYGNLISGYMNGWEIAEVVLSGVAVGLKTAASVMVVLEGILGSLPKTTTGAAGIATPVATFGADSKTYSAVTTAIMKGLEKGAEVTKDVADMIGKQGEYSRRAEEWKHEKKLAEHEAEQIEIQIKANELELYCSERELEIHKRTIEQNREIEDFYRRKFSNEALYNWMAGKLSALYFQSYKTAYDMAKSAEKCLQYEIPSTASYITPTHWDGLKKGLLAGESLLLQIDQMEKSHLAQDSRFIEIEKTISMNNDYRGELAMLLLKGACEFKLKEEIFDKDYPGHYFRVIKTIELTVVTSMDLAFYPDLEEYKPVNVTLIQMGNKTLLTPDKSGVMYLMDPSGSDQPGSVRVNWRANQQVAVSKVNQRDAGMFYMDFIFDNRYFPFEGTGLVSSWRLEIPHASNPDLVSNNLLNIEDVLIHIRYTAKSDRGRFKADVEKLLR